MSTKADRNMKWVPAKERIGGLTCIKSEVNEEVKLQGRYGDIWPYDDKGRYSALITCPRKANALFKRLGKRGGYKFGEEALLSAFSEDILFHVIKAIKPFKTSKKQIQKANEIDAPNLTTGSNSIQNASKSTRPGVCLSLGFNAENGLSLNHSAAFVLVKKGA